MLRLTPDSLDHHAEALTLVSSYSEKVPSLNLLIHGWLLLVRHFSDAMIRPFGLY